VGNNVASAHCDVEFTNKDGYHMKSSGVTMLTIKGGRSSKERIICSPWMNMSKSVGERRNRLSDRHRLLQAEKWSHRNFAEKITRKNIHGEAMHDTP
jgi:hypothetical protein